MVIDNRGTSSIAIEKPTGFVRVATIVKYHPEIFAVDILLTTPQQGRETIYTTQLPVSFLDPSGSFIGGNPTPGTPVLVAQGEGNSWFILGFLARDPAARNTIQIPNFPTLEKGQVLIQANQNNSILLDRVLGISIGEVNNSLTFDTARDILSNTFDHFYSLTESSREVDGVVYRDVFPNINYSSVLRSTSLDFNDSLKVIAMDPLFKENWSNIGSSIRNPSRTEKREVVFEYAQSFNVLSNDKELDSYKLNKDNSTTNILNRRESRVDALSLSLVSPNYLMETIKGNVVDIHGNLIDINRTVIPIGQLKNASLKDIKHNLDETSPLGNIYKTIKDLERQSLAYHFEINVRKDLLTPPEVNDEDEATKNYSRLRSRFSVDINKEGLLKVNIPATSEINSVPLLTRYENFSTVNPNETTDDPNDLVFNDNNVDILLDSFLPTENAVIDLVDENGASVSPLDRFSQDNSQKAVKHGTVYHNILDVCKVFQGDASILEYITTTSIGEQRIPAINPVVSDKIVVKGDNANAGGRSGQLNFDGSLEMNIGANTVDKQSLWVDMQGGMVWNVGKDTKNDASTYLNCDGGILIQSGGSQVNGDDDRFEGATVEAVDGFFDLRIVDKDGQALGVARFDNKGITLTTTGRLVMYSNQDIMMRSAATINIDGEQVYINSRLVKKDTGEGSI